MTPREYAPTPLSSSGLPARNYVLPDGVSANSSLRALANRHGARLERVQGALGGVTVTMEGESAALDALERDLVAMGCRPTGRTD